MSTMKGNSEVPFLKEIKDNFEDYTATIQAIQCFVGVMTWDNDLRRRLPDSKDCIGRRMDTSGENRVEPSTVVTPDVVIQRHSQLGYAVETKKTLSRKDNDWRDAVAQLEKYDDDLCGWWTEGERMPLHCVVMLIHQTRSSRFRRYLEHLIEEKKVLFKRPTSIVEFGNSNERRAYLFLRKYWGQIEDNTLSAQLEDGKSVPIEDVLANSPKKFYDSPPEIEYTMCILWQDIFNQRQAEVERDEKLKAKPLQINVSQLTEELQELFGSTGRQPREVEFPKVSWVRDALEAFVRLGIAQKQDDNGNYLVLFKRVPGELVEYFARHRDKATKKNAEPKQLRML